jgi:hypothetical protein
MKFEKTITGTELVISTSDSLEQVFRELDENPDSPFVGFSEGKDRRLPLVTDSRALYIRSNPFPYSAFKPWINFLDDRFKYKILVTFRELATHRITDPSFNTHYAADGSIIVDKMLNYPDHFIPIRFDVMAALMAEAFHFDAFEGHSTISVHLRKFERPTT